MARDYSQKKYVILPDTHPILRLKAEDVTVFDHELKWVINTMIYTMDVDGGVGLAAPQIGKSIKVIVMRPGQDPTGKAKAPIWDATARYYINPVIIKKSPVITKMDEGCLSLQGQSYCVPRAEWVEFVWQDLDEKKTVTKLFGWAARVFLHEYDHLEGILISDVGTKNEEK